MEVETRTFTVYTISQEEQEWLEDKGLWELLLNRLNNNERVEIEHS